MVAMDKLLECAEVNFRTTCEMLRYRQMKRAGVVSSVEEFLQLLHPGECEEEWNEEIWVSELRRTAAVSQLRDGGKGTGRVSVQRVRTHARTRLPHAAHRQSHGGTQRTVHPMGGATHGGR